MTQSDCSLSSPLVGRYYCCSVCNDRCRLGNERKSAAIIGSRTNRMNRGKLPRDTACIRFDMRCRLHFHRKTNGNPNASEPNDSLAVSACDSGSKSDFRPASKSQAEQMVSSCHCGVVLVLLLLLIDPNSNAYAVCDNCFYILHFSRSGTADLAELKLANRAMFEIN